MFLPCRALHVCLNALVSLPCTVWCLKAAGSSLFANSCWGVTPSQRNRGTCDVCCLFRHLVESDAPLPLQLLQTVLKSMTFNVDKGLGTPMALHWVLVSFMQIILVSMKTYFGTWSALPWAFGCVNMVKPSNFKALASWSKSVVGSLISWRWYRKKIWSKIRVLFLLFSSLFTWEVMRNNLA